MSTSSILVALGHLTTQVSTSINGIHDKLTALSNQVRCNDKKMSETLDSLNMYVNSMETHLDQKTCQFLTKQQQQSTKLNKHSENANPVTKQMDDKTISESNTATDASNSVNTVGYNPLKQIKND